jgi:hypothetical protein
MVRICMAQATGTHAASALPPGLQHSTPNSPTAAFTVLRCFIHAGSEAAAGA